MVRVLDDDGFDDGVGDEGLSFVNRFFKGD